MKKIVIMISLLMVFNRLLSRSPQRKKDPTLPVITTQWHGSPEIFELSYPHLQERPFFHLFDHTHFMQNQLPQGPIQYRNSDHVVEGATLSRLIEQFMSELAEGKETFTHFIILKKRDFNKKDKTGLIIAKFKDYPFVIKLFVETPKSFVYPLSKGFEPTCFFLMGGGVNRHLNGFTRLKNLHYLRNRIRHHQQWSASVDFPRKWFWLPTTQRWIDLKGYNIGRDPKRIKHISIPAIYAIVCDHIDVERVFSLMKKEDRKKALRLSNDLEQNIDPHINNYAIERHTQKIIPLDTEHFPTMVGYTKPPYCNDYLQWYVQLSFKMLKDCIGTTKKERRRKCLSPHSI